MSRDLQQTQIELESSQIDLKNTQEQSYHRLLELEVLYQTAPVGLGFLDRELRYVRLNEALARINGVSMEAHIGRKASEINRSLSDIVVPMMKEVLASRKPRLNVEIDGTVPNDSEHRRTWMVNLHPVSNATTFGVSVVFQDITALKETEDICTRFSLIVGSSDDAIISMTLDGAITSWNRAAENMFGYSQEEVLNNAVSFLEPPRRTNEILDILADLQRGGPARHYETVRRGKDGRNIDVSVTVSPVPDRQGYVTGASEIVRDITQQNRARAALLRSNEELRQFAFAAAHDLQEPLRNIGLYSQLLESKYKDRLDIEGDEQLQIVIESARRMQTLIRDLLEYAEVVDVCGPSGEIVDCNDVCRTALDNLASTLEDCSARVHVSNLPTLLMGERGHLVQMFQNLIGNAVKYRAKERAPEIHVSAERLDQEWVFSVADNGIGIAAEYHDRIFGVFKRLHGRDVPGTGIGLAICKRIVDHHGGRLWLQSEVGGGSTFYFSLPDSK